MLNLTQKYYKRGLLLPAVVLVLAYFVAIFIQNPGVDFDQKGEDYSEIAFDQLACLLVLMNGVFILALALPLITFDFSAKGKTARFLWWFLLPGSWIALLFFSGVYEGICGRGEDAFQLLSNSIPYLLGLIWGHVQYNRELANRVNGLPEIEIITKEDRKIQQPHTPPPQAPMG